MINHPTVRLIEDAYHELVTFKDDAACDHSVGICWCQYHLTVDRLARKLVKYRPDKYRLIGEIHEYAMAERIRE